MTPHGEGRTTARGDRLKSIASGMVREWAWRNVAEITADVGAVGRHAAESGAWEIARLPVQEADGASEGLTELAQLIDALEEPDRRRWSFLRGRFSRKPAAASDICPVLERERDAVLRRLTTLRRDRLRLEAADVSFERALALLGLLESGAAAVAREVAADHPAQAAMLRTEVVEVLSERRRDLQLQLLVLRQALAAHDLVADGQMSLLEALDRARNITIGAVRTSIAARAALGTAAPSNDRAGTGSTPLTDMIARLHAFIDHRDGG